MKNEEVHHKIHTLEKKIEKRPTFIQILGISVAGLSIVLALMSFIMSSLLTNQSGKITAETKILVMEAISVHADKEKVKWCEREESIINKVLVRLGLR